MIEILRLYIEQRFSVLKFLGLALFLFFYSLPFHAIEPLSILHILKILFMLFALRLYDDLMQWENDAVHSDRVYTKKEQRSKLILPLIVSLALSVLICLNDGTDYTIALLWMSFLLVNHVMYKALVHRRFWAFLLPLLKYPVLYLYLALCYLVSDEITISHWLNLEALLFSFVVYDLIDIPNQRKAPIYIYALIALSIALLLIPGLNVVTLVVAVVLLILSTILVITKFKRQIVPLVWLLLILIFKLIANNYVI